MLKDRLREARITRGLTQNDVASSMSVNYSTISSYETGRSEPNIFQLTQLMNILGVDANFLLQDEVAECRSYTSNALSLEEHELLDLFRTLNSKGRCLALSTIRGLAGNPEMQEEATPSEMA